MWDNSTIEAIGRVCDLAETGRAECPAVIIVGDMGTSELAKLIRDHYPHVEIIQANPLPVQEPPRYEASSNMALVLDEIASYASKAEAYAYDLPREPVEDLSYLYRAPVTRAAHDRRPIFHRRSDPRWSAGRWRSKT